MTPFQASLDMPIVEALISRLTALGQVGLVILLQTSLLLAIGFAFTFVTRTQRPALLSTIYRSLLIGVILTSIFSVALVGRIHPLWTITASGRQPTTPFLVTGSGSQSPLSSDPVPPAIHQSYISENTRLMAHAGATSYNRNNYWLYSLLAGIWATGTMIQLLWLLLASLHSARVRNRSNDIVDEDILVLLNQLSVKLNVRPPLLATHPGVQSPFLSGLLQPVILLPADYETAFNGPAIQAILLHELAHLARRDCLWKHMAGVTGAILWIQPLLWLLRGRLEHANESLCDETVISGGCPPRAYANFLLDAANRLPLKPVEQAVGLGIVPFRSTLGRRIQQIMKLSSDAPRPLSNTTRSVIAIGTTCALLSALMLVSVAEPQESKNEADGAVNPPVVRLQDPKVRSLPRPAPNTTAPDPANRKNAGMDFEGRPIAGTHVEGNRIIPEDRILAQATTKTGAALSSRQLNIDLARIDALGFFASVEYQVTQNPEDHTKVDVTFKVSENRVVAGFQFQGVKQFKSEELEKVLKSHKGDVLNRTMVAQDVDAIQRLYREKGFAGVVTETHQLDNGTLVFTVQEEKIARIELSGLEKVSPDIVRKEILTKPGDAFDQAKIRADLNHIYDLGFFADASFRMNDEIGKPGSVIVTLVLTEKPAK